MNKPRQRWGEKGFAVLLAGAMGLTLAGCGGSEGDTSGAVTVNAAVRVAQESADNYSENTNGLIEGSTLQHWLDDWPANRPDGISGDLVILQVFAGYRDDIKYVTPDAASGVRVYEIPTDAYVMTRSNGVTETISMVLDGEHMDALLKHYDIDPRQDMVVFAAGQAGGYQNMLVGRGWYLFRYWGAPATHLAILNGSIAHGLSSAYLGNSKSEAPGTGTVSVKDLSQDNTVLQATLGDVLDAAKTGDPDVFIWDARSEDEYNGVPNKTRGATGASCGAAGDSQCYTAFEGHPLGAAHLEYSELLVTDDGTQDFDGDGDLDASYRYKSKSVLDGLVSGAGYQDGQTIITYCRTTYRAMVTGIAAGVVLGHPTRFYDGAMIEWLQMAHWANTTGEMNLPETSPWRTDLVTASSFSQYNASVDVEAPTVVNAYASSSSSIIQADKAYKTGDSASDGSDGDADGGGSGPSLPSNPCGG